MSNFYSLNKILATNADMFLIIGQRGNGKTYAVLKYFLECYKKTKRRFCYIRRWAEDIKSFRSEQLFFPLQDVVKQLFGEDFTIQYYRHKYYLVNGNGTKVDTIGYCLSISEASHTKSVSYAGLSYILYDEFVQMSSENTLRDEQSKWENTLATLIRGDVLSCGVKPLIFLCANTVSRFSPYFIKYGFDINKIEQGQIVTKELPTNDDKQVLRVSLEYCEFNENVGNKISKYTASDMIRSGKWEIPPVDDIPSVVNEAVKEQLLFSIFEDQGNVILGCFLRRSKWFTLEQNEQTMLYYQKPHVREFLVIRTITTKSNYFHLSTEKSLNYHTYNDIDLMLNDIKEQTEIDFEHELYMGRVFCDNMYTADYFNNSWQRFGNVPARSLL